MYRKLLWDWLSLFELRRAPERLLVMGLLWPLGHEPMGMPRHRLEWSWLAWICFLVYLGLVPTGLTSS